MNAWLGLTTLLSLVLYIWTGLQAGQGRTRFNVPAPAMTGHPEFERLVRVQANMLEWLVIYLPCLWLFGLYLDARIASGIGAVWIVGRVIYAVSYARDPATRSTGFMIQALATLALLLGAFYGVARALMAGG